MIIGYHTSGLVHHDLMGGFELIQATGYQSVALAIDHGWLGPLDADRDVRLQQVKGFLVQHRMKSVIEVVSPFLLNPHQQHSPSLVDANQEMADQRIDLLRYSIDVAAELGSDCVSIKSGIKPNGLAFPSALELFVKNLRTVLEYAQKNGVELAIEPSPDMLIDNAGRFGRLFHLAGMEQLKLTLDIGQLFSVSEVPIANYFEQWQDVLMNVHLCDVRAGSDEHLMLGAGQVYFPPIFESLQRIGYQYGVHVQLDRHSHVGATAVRKSYSVVSPILEEVAMAE